MHWHLLSRRETLLPANWAAKDVPFRYTLQIELTEDSLICRPELEGRNKESIGYTMKYPED